MTRTERLPPLLQWPQWLQLEQAEQEAMSVHRVLGAAASLRYVRLGSRSMGSPGANTTTESNKNKYSYGGRSLEFKYGVAFFNGNVEN